MIDLKTIPEFSNINMNYAFDPMTKTYVKGLVLDYADYLLKRKRPFALFFIDVDNFKTINDTVGHQKGDSIMQEVAKRIMNVFGDKGIVGRYGGDEYIAILEDATEYSDVWNLSESLGKAAKEIQIIAPNDNGIHQLVTLTMGITRYPMDARSVTGLVEKADKALYRGKGKGRNCFIIYNKVLHGNLVIGQDASLDIYKIFDFIYSEIGDSVDNRKAHFKKVLCFLFHMFHMGGIYVQYENEFIEVISNGELKNVTPIPMYLYNAAGFLDSPLFVMNFRYPLMGTHQELVEYFVEQNIRAEVMIKLETKRKNYGYVRFDIDHERVWSKDELLILQTVVKLMCLMLSEEECKESL